MDGAAFTELNKEANEIKYNVEEPKLNLADQKDKNGFPNPAQQKKEFQEKQLDLALGKNKKSRQMSARLRAQILDPTIYVTKTKMNPPAYDKEKKKNLETESAIITDLSRKNIETDKKIAKTSSLQQKMDLEMKKLDAYAREKLKRMLALNTDPDQVDYIRDCVALDKVLKAQEICRTHIEDGPAKEEALKKCGVLVSSAEKRLKETIAIMENMKAVRAKKVRRTPTPGDTPEETVTKKETPKKSTTQKKEKPKKVKEEKPKKVKEEKQKKSVSKKNETTKKTKTTKGSSQGNQNIINEQDNNLIVYEKQEDVQMIQYRKRNGNKYQDYYFIKRKPENLKDALELRAQISRNFDVEKCPPELYPLYQYYEGFVEEYSKTEKIQFPEEYLEIVDVSSYTLETVVMLRNRLTENGLLYKDLKGKAKEAYDYYDRHARRLIDNDGTMKDTVVQHEARKMPEYHIMLDTNLGQEYEEQVPGSRDCWSCAGSAILNHYLRNTENYKKVTQKDFRAYKPSLKTREEMQVDAMTYMIQKNDIDAFTVRNQRKDRVGSPMGNPYMLADFYLEKLRDANIRNTAVRKKVFQPGLAVRQQNGFRNKKNELLGKDTNALHNLRAEFLDTVYRALKGDSAVSLLCGLHYVTIVGIDGDDLIVHNSSADPHQTQRWKVSDVLADEEDQRAVELVWFQKIKDPSEVTKQYRNLEYNPTYRCFGEKVKNYSENIAQKNGVGAWKNLDEKKDDISDLVMDGIYLPPQLFG